METKMITLPFEVEKAKKIQAGELPGKIVTRDGSDVRIVCWNRKDDTFPIVALVHFEKGTNEYCACYKANGYNLASESKYEKDLLLQIPEWTQFKDGDVLACEVVCGGGEYYKWYAILNGKVGHYPTGFHSEDLCFDSYVSYNYDSSYEAGEVVFNETCDNVDTIRLATDDEKQKLIDALKASPDPRSKEYLKRFFGIEEKPELEFEFLQPVLVRDNKVDSWGYGEFTFKRNGMYSVNGGTCWNRCIPYNEQTKHLLGTTDDWEEQE